MARNTTADQANSVAARNTAFWRTTKKLTIAMPSSIAMPSMTPRKNANSPLRDSNAERCQSVRSDRPAEVSSSAKACEVLGAMVKASASAPSARRSLNSRAELVVTE